VALKSPENIPILPFVVRRRSGPFAHIPPHLGVQLGVFSGSGGSTAKDTPNGKIHVIGTKGRINVKPETAVCYFPGGYSVDNDKLFDALNQSNLFNGRGRLRPAVKGRCEFTRDVVLFRGERSVNHNGYSKFVLSVWQKDVSTSEIAYWIAGIERTEGVNPRAADMKPDEYTSLEEVRRGGSAGYDQADLSDAFIGYVSGQ
jgi:hypothetical protein